MHIMVIKRYMRKYDTCVGHEAHKNKLLLKKTPGITSASSTSSKCEQSEDEPSRGLYWKREEKGGKTKTAKKYERWTEEGDEL